MPLFVVGVGKLYLLKLSGLAKLGKGEERKLRSYAVSPKSGLHRGNRPPLG